MIPSLILLFKITRSLPTSYHLCLPYFSFLALIFKHSIIFSYLYIICLHLKATEAKTFILFTVNLLQVGIVLQIK